MAKWRAVTKKGRRTLKDAFLAENKLADAVAQQEAQMAEEMEKGRVTTGG